jgi:periplasmic protein TonB
MKDEQAEKGQRNMVQLVTTMLVILAMIAGGVAVKRLVSKQVSVKKSERTVTMVKLPPPPKKYEKPPEMEKKEEPKEQEQVSIQDKPQETPQDQPPPGNQLGLDAEGGAGGDAFGLVGNKGGRTLIGSGSGEQSLMKKYGWYVRILEDEISRELAKKGKIPSGNLRAYVRLVIDEKGAIVSHKIYESSGNTQMDNAVNEILDFIKRLSEPPPEGMPRIVRIKISSPV